MAGWLGYLHAADVLIWIDVALLDFLSDKIDNRNVILFNRYIHGARSS